MFDFEIGDDVMIVDLKDYPECNDLQNGSLRAGDLGRVVDFRQRTVRVKNLRSGVTRNFLPFRIKKVALTRLDVRFVFG